MANATINNATIYDVATEADVSIATVSRVLNSPQQVNSATRQRVLQAIDKLDFVPKAEASARARKSNRRIGVLTPFFTHPSFVQRLRGIASVLNSTQYELVIYPVDTVTKYRSYLESLPVSRKIDGLVVMSLQINDEVAERLERHRLQTVILENSHPGFSSVAIDNQQGGWLATTHLLQKGHERIAYLGGNEEISGYSLPINKLRLAGYHQALREADVSPVDEYVCVGTYGMTSAYRYANQLFDLPEPPTAIFAMSDTMAMGVLKAARERGLRTPNDVAIIGFDALDTAKYIGLSTVSQSLDESGRIGVELLLGRLAEPTRTIQHVQLPLTVVEGETV